MTGVLPLAGVRTIGVLAAVLGVFAASALAGVDTLGVFGASDLAGVDTFAFLAWLLGGDTVDLLLVARDGVSTLEADLGVLAGVSDFDGVLEAEASSGSGSLLLGGGVFLGEVVGWVLVLATSTSMSSTFSSTSAFSSPDSPDTSLLVLVLGLLLYPELFLVLGTSFS